MNQASGSGRRWRRLAATLLAIFLTAGLLQPGAGAGEHTKGIPFRSEDAKVMVMVELSGAPMADLAPGQPAAAHADQLRSEQARLKAELAKERIGHKELSRHTTLFNGIAMEIRLADIGKLAALPGVKHVHISQKHQLPVPQLATSTAMINAPAAWAMAGAQGAGVKVAVIDTGIDYTHPDLGGCFGAGCRVVGGYDFVGDDFDGSNTPVPDFDPMDIAGHGTHVAGIIGARAAGPHGVTGVAPAVEFLALKVFGTAGSTWDSIVVQALEKAYELGADVVNMSLGSAFAWPNSPSAQASQRLTNKGVVVVASAGNSGAAGPFATGSPGVGAGAIAVASFENTHATKTGFLDPMGLPMGYDMMEFAPNLPASGLSAELVFAGLGTSDADFRNPDGSSKVAGKVALVSRGAISFREKSMRAQAHGAVQVLIHNNQPGAFRGTMGSPGDYLPTVSLSQADGLRLRSLIESGPVHLTYTGQFYQFVNGGAGFISGFSSWGPAPDLSVKPDLTAPGGSIFATYPLAKGGYSTLSGTSMAAPHVAGAAALLLDAHRDNLAHMAPKHQAEAVRAMLMNSARPQTMGPGAAALYPVHRQGAGMIDIVAAINSAARVVPDKLALGELDGVRSVEQRITLTNTSTEVQVYSFQVMGDGIALDASPTMIRLRPGQSRQVKLTLTADAAMADGLFQGWVQVLGNEGRLVAQIPYLGFMGDYQAQSALDPLAYGLPWLAALDGDGYLNPVNEMTITPGCNCEADAAYLVYSLARQVEELRVEIFDATTGRRMGDAYRAEFVARSNGNIHFIVWDGTTDAGRALRAGTYVLQLKALRPLGDRRNPAHWDIFTTGPIQVIYP